MSSVRTAARALHTVVTSKPPVREWLVILPDNTQVLARRIAIRPQHSPNFVRLHKEGYVSWAGPIFARPFVKGAVENRPFVGSVMIVNDTDPEAIRAKLKLDIYTQERIWDWENAEILPFHTLERSPAELEK